MPQLSETIDSLAADRDVAGAMVVSDEGLVVASSMPCTLEPETVAALAGTARRALAPYGTAIGQGDLRQAVIEAESGCSILTRLPSGATLVVLAAESGDLGDLLHRLRPDAPLLKELA